MTRFSSASDPYPMVSLAETDKPLPKRLDGHTRYAYFKTIARGGRSIIQSCKDLRMMRVICYKSLKPEFADDLVEQRRFIREARVSAMLQHPNTVPTYDIGRDSQGHLYFTMKLVHGYTLREILNFRERYDLTRLMEVVIQVAHGLGYAHNHGVAHRDIKPENVLVGPFGEVLLLDWGLAKVWQTPASKLRTRPRPAAANPSSRSRTKARRRARSRTCRRNRCATIRPSTTARTSTASARCSTKFWLAARPSRANPSTKSSTRR